MSTTEKTATENAAAIEAVRDRIDYFRTSDHSRAADLLREAYHLVLRGDYRMRVEAMIEDMGLEDYFSWSESTETYTGSLGIRLRVPLEDYTRAAAAMFLLLDGYGCDDAQPCGVDWVDGNPFTAFGHVSLSIAPS
jgi:hypothetical protein